MVERLTRQKFIRNCDAELTPCKLCSFDCGDEDKAKCWEMSVYNRLAAYEDTGLTPEELAALKEATTDAWLQLRTATFSTDKGAADLANFILSYLPKAPKEAENAEHKTC